MILNKYLLNDWIKLNLSFANSDKTEEINVSFSCRMEKQDSDIKWSEGKIASSASLPGL